MMDTFSHEDSFPANKRGAPSLDRAGGPLASADIVKIRAGPYRPALLLMRRELLFVRRSVAIRHQRRKQDQSAVPLPDRQRVELHREAFLAIFPFERDADRDPPPAIVRIRRANHELHFTLFLRLYRTPRDRSTSHDALLFSRSLECGCGHRAAARHPRTRTPIPIPKCIKPPEICMPE